MKHICAVLNKNPNDGNLRKLFYDTRRNYKKLLKSKRLDLERKKIEEMEISAYKGRDFWKDFKRIRNPRQDEVLPNPKKIQSFFENLYKETDDGAGIPSTEKQYSPICNFSQKITV